LSSVAQTPQSPCPRGIVRICPPKAVAERVGFEPTRPFRVLRRPLTKEDVRYAHEMVRRIATILLLRPALDANYEAVKSNTYVLPVQPA
jgi:hypothetical protein